MANARIRNGSLGVLNAQSPYCSVKRGTNINISGTFVGTVSLMRRDANGNVTAVTNAAGAAVTFTVPTNYNLSPINVQGDYALKMTAYTSGTAITAMEGW
jgi:hypothetical protein